MADSSNVLIYSLANFNGTIIFQIHHQDANFTDWLKATKPMCQEFDVRSLDEPEIDLSLRTIFLRGRRTLADKNLVQYSTDDDPDTTISKIHKALEEAVSLYRRARPPP